MGFRPDKNAWRHIESQPRTGVEKKVVAALKVGTADKITLEKRCVETQALCTDSTLEFYLRPLTEGRRINSIEVIENWSVGIEKDVHVLATPPGHVAAQTEVFLPEQKIAAESGIGASANALRRMVSIVKRIRGRLAEYGSHAEGQIKLLSVGSARAQKKQTKDRNTQE